MPQLNKQTMQKELTKDQAIKLSLNHTFAKSNTVAKGSLENGGTIAIVVKEITTDQLSDIDWLAKTHDVKVLMKRSGTGISIHFN